MKTITAAAISAPVAPVPRRYARVCVNRGARVSVSASVVIGSKGCHATAGSCAVRGQSPSPKTNQPHLREIPHRVDRLAVDPDLEVEVWAEAEPRAVADPDHLALADMLADGDGDR